MKMSIWAALAVAVCVVGEASSHEFWIEPSSFRPSANSIVQVGLFVGDGFPGEAVKRNSEKIDRFFALIDSESRDLVGRDGAEPAGLLKVEKPGAVILGYRSKHSSIELQAAKFEAYLKDEGLESIIAKRKERGDSDKPGREIYSRCSKCLLNVDGAAGVGYDKAVGFPLEIIIDADPAALHAGDEISCRLLLDGKPLEGALIRASHKTEKEKNSSARSDSEGRVRLKLPAEGMWMIHCVHMKETPKDSNADWESLWASLTLQIGEGKVAKAAKP